MSEPRTPTWTVWPDGDRGARTISTGDRITARRRSDETAEAFAERLRWGRLDELIIDWVRHLKADSPKAKLTTRQYRSDCNAVILPELGDLWLVDCDATRWRTFARSLAKRQGVGRLEDAQRTVGALITWALDEDRWPALPAFGGQERRRAIQKSVVSYAPVTSARSGKRRIKTSDCPTVEQTWDFADALGDAAAAKWGEDARPVGDVVRAQYLTGARIATAFAFAATDFDLDRRLAFIHRQVDRTASWAIKGLDAEALKSFVPPLELVKQKNPDGHEASLWEWADDDIARILGQTDGRSEWLFATCIPSARPLDAFEQLYREVRREKDYKWTSHWHRHAYASLNLAPICEGGYGRGVATVAGWLGDGIKVVQDTYWHPSTDAPSGWSAHRPGAAP